MGISEGEEQRERDGGDAIKVILHSDGFSMYLMSLRPGQHQKKLIANDKTRDVYKLRRSILSQHCIWVVPDDP